MRLYLHYQSNEKKTNKMKNQAKYYVFHNQYGHALPQIISSKGMAITIELEKLNDELKNKIFGKNEIVDFSIDEAKVLFEKKYKSRQAGEVELKNLFA